MKITVYSKPNCGACDYTKMWLDNHGIEYVAIDAYEDLEAMELIQEKGFMGFPVVSVDNFTKAWAGLDMDGLEGLLDE